MEGHKGYQRMEHLSARASSDRRQPSLFEWLEQAVALNTPWDAIDPELMRRLPQHLLNDLPNQILQGKELHG